MIKIKITKKGIANYFKAAVIELSVIAGVLFVDILSKFLVSKYIPEGSSRVIIPKFLNFTYTKNTQAAFNFSFFGLDKLIGTEGLRWFFIAFVIVATSVFTIFMVTGVKNRLWYRLSLALIIGGALGNLYDRIFHKAVRDFIEVVYFGGTLFGSPSFAIFNLADSALVSGMIMFVVYFLFFYIKDEKAKETAKATAATGTTITDEGILSSKVNHSGSAEETQNGESSEVNHSDSAEETHGKNDLNVESVESNENKENICGPASDSGIIYAEQPALYAEQAAEKAAESKATDETAEKTATKPVPKTAKKTAPKNFALPERDSPEKSKKKEGDR